MLTIGPLISCVAAFAAVAIGDANVSKPLGSRIVLPSTFIPPQVFQHANLVRTIQLSKSYPKETVNLVVENIDKQPQSEYYIPFEQSLLSRVGGLEVSDKKTQKRFRDVEVVTIDADRYARVPDN